MVARESLEVDAPADECRLMFAQAVDAVLRVVAVHDGDIVAFADATFLCCECNEDFLTHGSIQFNC